MKKELNYLRKSAKKNESADYAENAEKKDRITEKTYRQDNRIDRNKKK